MNRFHRLLLAATLACMPFLAQAQGFKCKQADGSVSYQDHACAAGTASSSAIVTDMSLDIGLPPLTGMDATCQQNVHHMVTACMSPIQESLKSCYRARLSSHCYAQMLGGTRRDPVCVQQASPCMADGLATAKRCVMNEVAPACAQQLRNAGMH